MEGVKEEFDPVHGGFGSPSRAFRGTKFPTPPYLRLLQHEIERTKNKELSDVPSSAMPPEYVGLAVFSRDGHRACSKGAAHIRGHTCWYVSSRF